MSENPNTYRMLAAPCLVAMALAISALEAQAAKPAWDQVANIKAAAAQIGGIQVQQGVAAAFKFIGACYKTHGLASAYSKSFEGCIAQDYMQSRALALVYDRLPDDQLKSMGAPTSEEVMASMSTRVSAAFGQYKIPVKDGQAFLRLVETHGMPQFLTIVFPQRPGDAPATSQGPAPTAPR